jgi:DNA-binding response OmpR family regulator
MGAPRARTGPDVVTSGTRAGASAAAVLDFAVAQIMGDDTALGALPAVLGRLADTFGLRAALAFQPSAAQSPTVLAPVLILTAHDKEADKVRGLHGGADDYLTKPFGNRELAARVEALLRRPRTEQPQAEVYDDGRLLVNLGAREVSVGGAPVVLTPTEFRLLGALIRRPGQILSPDQLLELAWNDPLGVGPERVKFGVMRLRRKLGQGPGEPGARIEAVRGFGYRYVPPA